MAKNNATKSVESTAPKSANSATGESTQINNNGTDSANIADAKSIATAAAATSNSTPTPTPTRPWYADTIESEAFAALTSLERKSTITDAVVKRMWTDHAYTSASEDKRNSMVNSEVQSIMGQYDSIARKRQRELDIAQQRAEYNAQQAKLREVNAARAKEAGVDESIMDKPASTDESPEVRQLREQMAALKVKLAEQERAARYTHIQPLIDVYETGRTPFVDAVTTIQAEFDSAKARLDLAKSMLNDYELTDPRKLVDKSGSTSSATKSTSTRTRTPKNGESGENNRTTKAWQLFQFAIPSDEAALLDNKPRVSVGELEPSTNTHTATIAIKGELSNGAYYAREKLSGWLQYKPDVERVATREYDEWDGNGEWLATD